MIEVKTGLNKDALLKLNMFHLFKKNFLIIPIFVLVFVTLGALMYLFPDDEGEKYFGIIFAIVFGIGFPLLSVGMMRLMVWLQTRSSKFIAQDTQIFFRFDDNILYNRMQKPGMVSTSEWEWRMCYKAYETKDDFLISF